MQKQIQALVQKEVTRKEFMATLGLGAASLMGLGSILKLVNSQSGSSQKASSGYGSSGYGR